MCSLALFTVGSWKMKNKYQGKKWSEWTGLLGCLSFTDHTTTETSDISEAKAAFQCLKLTHLTEKRWFEISFGKDLLKTLAGIFFFKFQCCESWLH